MDRTSWKPKIFKATEAVDYKANETQYGTLNPDGSVTNKMDLDDSNSDDPIAYNFGFFEGKSGKPMDDYDDLAPEYVRGYNDGKKSIGESKAKAVEKTVLEVAKYYEGEQSFEEQFQAWIDPSNYSSRDAYKDATGGYMIDDEHSRIEFARWQLGYDESSHWYMDYEGESKANELDLKNYTINPFDDVWVSECKKCGAEFTEFDYDNSENSVRNHLMSEHDIDESHLGSTLYNQNESKANEDDHKKSWGELDSIAKMGFSDIGYDQQSWDSEPEEIRAEMETVVKDNLGENWKEVANKFYKEELNKGKKSGGESKVKRYKVGDDYYDDLDDAKQMSDVTGYAVFDNDNWGKMVYDGESKASEADPCWKGYKQIGMKDKNGKQVPNCVPNSSGNEYSLPSMFKKKKSNFHNTSFKDYAKVFEEPIESKWERKKHVLGGDFYDFFRLEWNSVPSEIQDIFRATVSVESKASEADDWECKDCGVKTSNPVHHQKDTGHNNIEQAPRFGECINCGSPVEAPYYIEDYVDCRNCGTHFKFVDAKSLESKASEYYGQSEPDKLLFTIRCEKCYDIIRDDLDQMAKQKAHDHLINEHQYTWLPTKRKFEHDEQNRVYQKMISNMEYSKSNYSDSVFESKADEFSDWGNWSEDQPKMSQRDQISIMKDRGIDDKTLIKMGLKYFLDDYNSQKNGIEGFIDRIEKELNKFGINLDKPEEQEQED